MILRSCALFWLISRFSTLIVLVIGSDGDNLVDFYNITLYYVSVSATFVDWNRLIG